MKQANKEAKKVIAAIIDQMTSDNLKIDVNGKDSGIMPLVVEKVGFDVTTPYGMANIFSFAHYYEQEGDLMRDPEICFLIVDNREQYKAAGLDELDGFGVWPQSFQQDGVFGRYQELVTIEDGKATRYMKSAQSDVAVFTGQWMQNIKWQQNIGK